MWRKRYRKKIFCLITVLETPTLIQVWMSSYICTCTCIYMFMPTLKQNSCVRPWYGSFQLSLGKYRLAQFKIWNIVLQKSKQTRHKSAQYGNYSTCTGQLPRTSKQTDIYKVADYKVVFILIVFHGRQQSNNYFFQSVSLIFGRVMGFTVNLYFKNCYLYFCCLLVLIFVFTMF